MKIFTSKNLISKLIISILACLILVNFCMAPSVKAEGTSFGGKMMSIMRDFTTAIADVAGSLVQFGMTGKWTDAVDSKGTGVPDGSGSKSDYWITYDKFRYPILQVSPEVIFANKIQLLDANFISTPGENDYLVEAQDTSPLSSLRNIIAGWYVTLRTIAIVGLLSVLIYVGIRIIISSTAADKAKYKQRLVDWIVAFCLLFFMHYIMAAVCTVVDKVDDMLGENVINGLKINPDYGGVKYVPTGENLGTSVGGEAGAWQEIISGVSSDDVAIEQAKTAISNKGFNVISESGEWTFSNSETVMLLTRIDTYKYTITCDKAEATLIKKITTTTQLQADMPPSVTNSYELRIEGTEETETTPGAVTNSNGLRVSSDPSKVLYFTNYARLFLNVKDKDEYLPMSTAYLIIYIALITFTAVFTVRYIKRVIYVAFLTLMAPMVALTYPIDKIKDRKSPGMEYVV